MLRIELTATTEHSGLVMRSRVRFAHSPRLDMLVPIRMEETYEGGGVRIERRAEYTNFRRFEVQVKVR